jgi:hypothetical protein
MSVFSRWRRVLVALNAGVLVTAFVPPASLRSTPLPSRGALTLAATTPIPPPPLDFTPAPLPLVLAGGLWLFRTSVPAKDRAVCDALLQQAQTVLRADPLVTGELGQGLETGGVYASQRTTSIASWDQLLVQFQIEGGNSWAQGLAYGVQAKANSNKGGIQLVSLSVSNMDSSMNGTPFQVRIPTDNVADTVL